MANASALSVKGSHAKIFNTPNSTKAVYCDLTTHELQNLCIMLVSHFQFSAFWWQDPLSRHQSRLCIVFTRTHWVWQVAFRGGFWIYSTLFVSVIQPDEIVFERVWQVVFDYLFLYSWEWYNELGLTLTAWQAWMDTARTDQRVDDWGAISQIVVVTSILLVINVCLEIMLLSILETKVDLQLWSDASPSVHRAKSAGSNRWGLPWISDQRVRGWDSSLHENELFHELLGIWVRCHWTATDRNSKNQLRALLIVYLLLLLYCWTKSTIVEKVCANSANILFLKSSCIGTLNCPIHIWDYTLYFYTGSQTTQGFFSILQQYLTWILIFNTVYKVWDNFSTKMGKKSLT